MYKHLTMRSKAIPPHSEDELPEEQGMPDVPNITHARKMLVVAQENPDHPIAKKLIEHISERYPHLVGESGLGGAQHQEEMEEIRQKLAGQDQGQDMEAHEEGANAETAEHAAGLAETAEIENARGKKVKSKDLAPLV